MFQTVMKLWRDEAGFVLTAELVLIATVVTLSLVVGLAEVSNAVNNELGDMAGAVEGMSQDAWYEGSSEGDSQDYSFDQTGA